MPDSRGLPFQAPAYLGIAALDESLLFMPIETQGISLYEQFRAREDGLRWRLEKAVEGEGGWW